MLHYLGAIDKKRVKITNPPHAGSTIFNCKTFFSHCPPAMADPDYMFSHVVIGREGSASKTQIVNHSDLNEAIEVDHMH